MKRIAFLVTVLTVMLATIPLTTYGWTRTYGGSGRDIGYAVQQTLDGGYVVTGEKAGKQWLLKTDAQGDTMWTSVYGWGRSYSVDETTDGGYILTGQGNSRFIWIQKTDAQGHVLWARLYGRGTGRSVEQTEDGGYIIAGWYDTGDHYELADLCLLKTDSLGDTLWTRTWRILSDQYGYSVQQTMDGGYVITGYLHFWGSSPRYLWLLKTDAQGRSVWEHAYGGEGPYNGSYVQQTRDGGYIITGRRGTASFINAYLWLLKTDEDGDTVWTQIYGKTGWNEGCCVRETVDGGYIAVGIKDCKPGNLWLLKTDGEGDTLWTRIYGGVDVDC
ncbi:MAG: hypothetical protein U9Q76_07320, partial [candidate division WOR-3 bacterium]|nr:hypothetical protein [candidate division WOR-3 bacterium]